MLHYVHAGGEWVKAEKDIYNYDGAVAVDDIELLPTEFVLKQNYPNPFNPSTTISYDVSKTDNVKIIIYDILGNYVNTLVDEMKSPGQYSKSFDASKLASGTYIYTLKSGNIILSKKCLLIK